MIIYIFSCLHGHRLAYSKTFLQPNGREIETFTENFAGTVSWVEMLLETQAAGSLGDAPEYPVLLLFTQAILLGPERLHRPSASQVLHKLIDFDIACRPRGVLEH